MRGLNPDYSFWSNFERMEGYVTLAHVFMYFLIVSSVFNTKKLWEYFLNYIVATSFIHAFYALLQFGGQAKVSMTADRIDGTFGNAIYLAGFMLLSLFISIYLWMQRSDKSWAKYFYGSAIILQIITIFLTGTRGAILGLGAGVFVALVSYVILEPKRKILRYGLLSFLIVVALFVTVVFGFKDSALVQNTVALKRMSEISLESGTVQARLINWGIAWNAVKERPLLGYGQGNYSIIFDKNYDIRLWSQENWFDRSHSLVMDWLIAGGFLGFIAYLSIILSAIVYVWKSKDVFSNQEKSALTAFFVGYFIHTSFVFDNITSYMLLFIVLGLIHSRVSTHFKFCEKYNLSKNISAALIFIVAVTTPYMVWAVNSNSYLQNREIIKAMQIKNSTDVEQSLQYFQSALKRESLGQQEAILQFMSLAIKVASSPEVSDEIKAKFYESVFYEVNKYISENPDDARSMYIAGQYFAQIGNYQFAEDLMSRAISVAPKKQFLYQPKIELFFAMNRNQEAIDLLEYAYAINKENDNFWEYSVLVLSRAKQDEKYSALIEEAFKENKGYRVINLAKNNLERSPENINAYVTLAVSYYRNGDSEKAIEIINETIVKFPTAKSQLEGVIKKINAGQKVF
jgi:O-antigen ligase